MSHRYTVGMRTIRVHHAAALAAGAVLRLDDRAGRHLTRVLRLKPGAPVVVFDGLGHEHDGMLGSGRDGSVEVTLGAAREPLTPSPLVIRLAQGVSRGDRMDYAIQKATELGATAIVPLLCERSVVKLDHHQATRKHAHWHGVAVAAAEQCGRADLPVVGETVSLEHHLAQAATAQDDVTRLVLDPTCATGARSLAGDVRQVELLIGPEGGLSDRELDLARRAGYLALRLGPRILRTETAAAAAIAVLQTLYGDLA